MKASYQEPGGFFRGTSFQFCLFKTSQESLGPHLHLEASVSFFDPPPPIGSDLIFQLHEFLGCHYDHYSFIYGSHLPIIPRSAHTLWRAKWQVEGWVIVASVDKQWTGLYVFLSRSQQRVAAFH